LWPRTVVCLVAMATRKKAEPEKEQPKEAASEDTPQSATLQKAAKAIGSALGAIAVKTGIATPPKKKIGKLVKKNKSRLPRKEKKQAKKTAAKQVR
jgi:hypothetical protein